MFTNPLRLHGICVEHLKAIQTSSNCFKQNFTFVCFDNKKNKKSQL